MKDLVKKEFERTTCIKCGRDFDIVWLRYPCDMEGKHKSYYACPYCGEITNVDLHGNEDVDSQKVE